MTVLSSVLSASGASLAAHGVHYAIVAVGIVGLVALLVPRFLPSAGGPRDAHEARVRALRQALETPYDPARPAALDSVLVASRVRFHEAELTSVQRVLLPLAVVGSAAAAGVHAAMGPAHLREALLFGVFFGTCALAQVLWAGALALRPSYSLLVAGAVGNVAVLVLWATTRTVGLPFGLLPQPEPVGPWDLTCAAWELLVVGCCISVLQREGPLPSRLVEAWRWHPWVRTFAAVSAVGLVALSLSGAAG